jgi:DNA-binding Lrp family transcriptional regulator
MTYTVDEIDQRVLHALLSDARNTSATSIAENLTVSAATVRNRVDRLEAEGVVRGYTTAVDFERLGYLTSVFACTVPTDRRSEVAAAARAIPGVISIRMLMAGRRDLQIVAVGETTDELGEIARILTELGAEVEDEKLLQTEIHAPYGPFSPPDPADEPAHEGTLDPDEPTAIEVRVAADAPIAGLSIDTARQRDVLPEGAVIVAIERDGRTIQPTPETVLGRGDAATVVPTDGSDDAIRTTFTTGRNQFRS